MAGDPQIIQRPDLKASLGTQIGNVGRAGTVFALGSDSVYKQYHADLVDTRSPSHVQMLVDWYNALSDQERRFIDQRMCWPKSSVMEGEHTVGFVMNRAPAEYWVTTRQGIRRLRSLQDLISPDPYIGTRNPTLSERLELLTQYIELTDFLTRHKVLYTDLSGLNILWSDPQIADDVPKLLVIDCDSSVLLGVSEPVGANFGSLGWSTLDQVADVDTAIRTIGLFYIRCCLGTLAVLTDLSEPELADEASRLHIYHSDEFSRLAYRSVNDLEDAPTCQEWLAVIVKEADRRMHASGSHTLRFAHIVAIALGVFLIVLMTMLLIVFGELPFI